MHKDNFFKILIFFSLCAVIFIYKTSDGKFDDLRNRNEQLEEELELYKDKVKTSEKGLKSYEKKNKSIEETLALYKKNYTEADDKNEELGKKCKYYESILKDYLFSLKLNELKQALIKIYDVRAGIKNIEIKEEMDLSSDTFELIIVRNKELIEWINNLFRYNGKETIYTNNDFDLKFVGMRVLDKKENDNEIIYKIEIDKIKTEHHIEFSKELSELLGINSRKTIINYEENSSF